MRYPAYVVKGRSVESAAFPDCPGCQTQADRGEDLGKNLVEALTGWLEAELQAGRVPSRPRAAARAPKGGRVHWVQLPAMLGTRLALLWARTDADALDAELVIGLQARTA